jgi:hypothetical protein
VRHAISLIWIVLVIAACGQAQPSPDPTGILLVNAGDQVQAVPPNEAMANALSRATDIAQANGDDIGYAFVDPVNGELVVSAVTARGRTLLMAAGISVPYRIRDVLHGAAELDRIQHDVTTLRGQGVPGADLIWASFPDQRDNRTLIVISAYSRELLDSLALHYDADALAVKVSPR